MHVNLRARSIIGGVGGVGVVAARRAAHHVHRRVLDDRAPQVEAPHEDQRRRLCPDARPGAHRLLVAAAAAPLLLLPLPPPCALPP